MPQFVTNTMRLCTRDAINASYDATVPVKPRYRKNANSDYSETPTFDEQELCSSTPYDVPWSLDDAAAAENPSAMFSVGNVPMWDGTPLPGNAKYPADGYASQLYNTNPGTAFRTWGEGCMDGALLECVQDSDCASLRPDKVKLECYRGVCVMDMQQSPSCYSHRDCAQWGLMCSGDGQCVMPVVQVGARPYTLTHI
jgi:hypothetical protein